MVDQAERLCFRRIDEISGQDQLHCFSLTDQPCESLRSATARNDTEIDFRLTELCGLRSDSKVAGQGQFHAAAKTETVDHRNYRLREFLDGIKDTPLLHHITLCQRRPALKLADIRSEEHTS